MLQTPKIDRIKCESLKEFSWTTDIFVPINAVIDFLVDLNQEWRRIIFNEGFKERLHLT